MKPLPDRLSTGPCAVNERLLPGLLDPAEQALLTLRHERARLGRRRRLVRPFSCRRTFTTLTVTNSMVGALLADGYNAARLEKLGDVEECPARVDADVLDADLHRAAVPMASPSSAVWRRRRRRQSHRGISSRE